MKRKTHRRSEDRELNQATSKPDTVDTPVRTARTFVHHYNSTQYCSTDTFFLIFPLFQTNITSQIWPSGGKRVWNKLNVDRLTYLDHTKDVAYKTICNLEVYRL